MNRYFISTNFGWIKTNDERMAEMPFTIDEAIANPSLIGEGTTIYFVTKNDEDYWEAGNYINS